MEIEFDLKYSDEALLSRALLLISKNKLNIFVEDTHKEYEYEEIFERLLPEEIKISCIFPTGGKTFLEESYNLFGNSDEYGNCFFIADGDFDLILGKNVIVGDNFLYLRRYNIESYLLHKETTLQFMRPKLRKTYAETKEIVDYDNWINTITPFLERLFALHCLVQMYCPEIKNVARGVERFLDKRGYPNVSMFEAYKKEIIEFIPDLDTKIEQMLLRLKEVYGSELSSFVCGKCYISSLKMFLNSKLTKKISYNDLKAALISSFDISQLNYVKDKLFAYIAS